MKKTKFILCIALSLIAGTSAFAKSGNDKEPLNVSKLKEGWFIGLDGGITTVTEPGLGYGFTGDIAPHLEFKFGKWVSPVFGVSLGIEGGYMKEWVGNYRPYITPDTPVMHNGELKYEAKLSYIYVHNSFLFNFNNIFGGYKRDRLWNIIPYTDWGVIQTFGTGAHLIRREYTAGLGFINNFKFKTGTSVFLDLRADGLIYRSTKSPVENPAFLLAGSIGVTQDLGKNNWDYAKANTAHDVDRQKFFSNAFVGVHSGVMLMGETGQNMWTGNVSSVSDINIGKWFSPELGVRLGYEFGEMAEYLKTARAGLTVEDPKINNGGKYDCRYDFGYIHGDFMWNFLNTTSYYSPERVFDFIPYTHFGIINIWNRNNDYFTTEYLGGFGFIGTWQIGKHMSVYGDLRTYVIKGNTTNQGSGYAWGESLTAGLMYNIEGGDRWALNRAPEYANSKIKKVYNREEWRRDGSFESNGIGDNWFVGTSVGVAHLLENGEKINWDGNYTPTFEFFGGKWLSPIFGLRLGLQGSKLYTWSHSERPHVTGSETTPHKGEDLYRVRMNYVQVHADMMWDLNTMIAGYNPERVWSIQPYTTFGVMQTLSEQYKFVRREYTAGAGFINSFRISEHSKVFADIRGTALIGRQTESETGGHSYVHYATAGFTYEIGKNYWTKPTEGTPHEKFDSGHFLDRTFFSVEGGLSMMFEVGTGASPRLTSLADISFGKWFSPDLGAKLGVASGTFSEWLKSERPESAVKPLDYKSGEKIDCSFDYIYAHGDILWNATNTFMGAHDERFWNIVPYVQFGMYNTYGRNGSNYKNEFGANVGLIGDFKIGDGMSAFVDLRTHLLKSNTVDISRGTVPAVSAMAGLTYTLDTKGDRWHTTPEGAVVSENKLYEINGIGDNWFIEFGAGVSHLREDNEIVNTMLSPVMKLSGGKWVSPVFGFKVGFQGLRTNMWTANERRDLTRDYGYGGYKVTTKYLYVNADFMWNMNNLIGGYNPDRKWSIITYGEFGVNQNFNTEWKLIRREYAMGAGLIASMKLGERSNIFLDLKGLGLMGRQYRRADDNTHDWMHTAMVGLNYEIGKNYWNAANPSNAGGKADNSIFDNTFIAMSGGPSCMFDTDENGGNGGLSMNNDITFGKWYSPRIGVRIGLNSGDFSERVKNDRDGYPAVFQLPDGTYRCQYRYTYAHGDFMWNISNTFWDYKPERKWEVVPYVGMGITNIFTNSGSHIRDEFQANLGTMLLYNIDSKFSLFADAKGYIIKGNATGEHKGYTGGFALNFGGMYKIARPDWVPSSNWDKKSGRYETKRFAISTNIMDYVLWGGSPNLELQYSFCRHWSIDTRMSHNHWSNLRDMFQLGARYWFWDSFSGFWLKGAAQVVSYSDKGFDSKVSGQTGNAFGPTVSVGYSYMVSEHFNIDLGIGCWGGVRSYGQNTNVGFFGLNDANVSLMFVF